MPAIRPASILFAAACLAALGLGAATDRSVRTTSPFAGPAESHRSVQLHVHSSFSEGPGSIASGTWEASRLGLDAIWWSDHDWRLAYRKHVSSFSFDDFFEPIETGESWIPSHVDERGHKGLIPLPTAPSFTVMESELVPPPDAFEGEAALRLRGASNSAEFKRFAALFKATRAREKRNLSSGVVLMLALRVEEASADARPFVDVTLSKHLSGSWTSPQEIRLHYHAAGKDAVPHREENTWFVPLPYRLGDWQELAFEVGADLAVGFPDVEVGDNSLFEVVLGVESRNNAVTEAFFDALRIEHRPGEEGLLGDQRELLAKIEARVPGVRQLQGEEVSYHRHMNVFSVEAQLPDYDQLIRDSGLADAQGWISDLAALEDFVARKVVEDAHLRGGLVSLNHIFGTDGNPDPRPYEAIRDEVLAARAWGAEILEVGYRDRGGHPLPDFLRLWDDLALQGLPLIGVGVSDHHGDGPAGSWATTQNNFVTWIYSASLDQPDMLAGLARGRAFFGDLSLFRGWVDLGTDSGFLMGQTVITDRRRVGLDVHASGLTPGDRLRLIRSGAVVHEETATSSGFSRRLDVPIARRGGAFFRLEVYRADGEAKAFSNPIWLMREAPAGGLAPERAAFDLGGARSRSIRGFRLRDASFTAAGAGGTLRLVGGAAGGSMVIDFSGASLPTQVQFMGHLSGTGSLNGGLLELIDLDGDGWIEIDT